MLDNWARTWGIPPAAILDLRAQMGVYDFPVAPGDSPEAVVQAKTRIAASKEGAILWRNNVGAVNGENGFIRYGLANESHAMNKRIKSSDLIGIRPTLITPEMVGDTIGKFVAIECKHEGWRYRGNEHEQAQLRFLELVNAKGGEGHFRSWK